MTLKQQEKRAQKIVDDWNATYPIGQAVVVKKDFEKEGTITKTRSAAAVVSCSPVVWLEGIAGCYDLKVVTPIKEEKFP